MMMPVLLESGWVKLLLLDNTTTQSRPARLTSRATPIQQQVLSTRDPREL